MSGEGAGPVIENKSHVDGIGKDPQPADMRGYACTRSDNGGVHLNSGILNRVFYLVATDTLGTEGAAKVWYCALQNLWPTANFAAFADVLIHTARQLIDEMAVPPGAMRTIQRALKEVGL